MNTLEKNRLFLNSTDVMQMTGLSIRSARNMMQHIRDECQLGNHQVISIFDFSAIFHFPVPFLYEYINTDLFVNGPIDEDAARRAYRKEILETTDMSFLNSPDLKIFMTAKDLKKRQQEQADATAVVDDVA